MSVTFGRITAAHDIIHARYDPARFVGRQWLVEQVAAFRDDPQGRSLVIVGEPGSGKSAFVAHLAEKWNCPRHFIRLGSASATTGVAPKNFLCSIGAQLYQKYGGAIFDRPAGGSVQVKVGFASGKSEIVGQYIDELYALPFLPLQEEGVKVAVGAAIGDSKVVGRHIGRMVSVVETLEAEELLHAAVLNPLKKLEELRPEERVVVLIDALDESAARSAKSILDVIPSDDDVDFPANLRLVMTSRGGDHLARFRPETQLSLDDSDRGFKQLQAKDARRFVESRLEGAPLKSIIADLPKKQRSEWASKISRRSDGNFLYLYHLFKALIEAIEQGQRNIWELPVPKGLDEIYRIFAVEKIKAGKAIESWIGTYLPILGALAITQEPLRREEVAGFAGVASEYADFVLAEIKQFLDITREEQANRYGIYHRSFGEYLLDPSRNRDYPIRAEEAHRRVAAYYRRGCERWSEVKWRGREDGYAYRHLATHLTAADLSDELFELLDAPWIATKISQPESYVTLISDFHVAAVAASKKDPPDIARVVGLSVARDTARELTLSFPKDLLVAWIQTGQTERAINALESVAGPILHRTDSGDGIKLRADPRAIELQTAVAQELANGACEAGGLEERASIVNALLENGLDLLHRVIGSFRRLDSLEHILQVTLIRGALSSDQQLSLLEAAEKQARRTEKPEEMAACFGLVAEAYLRSGFDGDSIARLARYAEEALRRAPSPADVLAAQAYLLPVRQTESGGDVIACLRSLIESVQDPFEQSSITDSVLALLIRRSALSRQSSADAAAPFLLELGELCVERKAGTAAREVVRALCSLGRPGDAFELIDRLGRSGAFPGGEALFGAVSELFEADEARTSAWLEEAQQHLSIFSRLPGHITFFQNFQYAPSLALSYARTGRWDLAFKTLSAGERKVGASDFVELVRTAAKQAAGTENVFRLLTEFERLRPDASSQDRAALFAAAGYALLNVDPESSAEYLKRAERLCLSKVNRAAVDPLHILAAVGLHEQGDVEGALDHALSIKDKPKVVETLEKLINSTRPEQGESLQTLVANLLYWLKPADSEEPLAEAPCDEARLRVMKMVPALYEKNRDHATLIANYLLKTTSTPTNAEDALRYIMGLACAYTKIDLGAALSWFDTVIGKIREWLDGHFVFDYGVAEDLLDGLQVSATHAPDQFRTRIEEVRALVEKAPDNGLNALLCLKAALAMARFDPSVTERDLKSRIQKIGEIDEEAPIGDASPSRYLMAMIEMVSEKAGTQMYEAAQAGLICETIIQFAKYDPDRAAGLMTSLFQTILSIGSLADRGQALVNMLDGWSKAPKEFQFLTREILLDIIKHAEEIALSEKDNYDPEIYRVAAYIYDHGIKAFCELGLFDAAERLFRLRADITAEGAEQISMTIGVAKRKREAGELSASEREYVTDPNNDLLWAYLLLCKVEKKGGEMLKTLLGAIAKDEMDASQILRRIREMMIMAVSVGGIELASRIVRSIEEYNDRFERGAELVAAGS